MNLNKNLVKCIYRTTVAIIKTQIKGVLLLFDRWPRVFNVITLLQIQPLYNSTNWLNTWAYGIYWFRIIANFKLLSYIYVIYVWDFKQVWLILGWIFPITSDFNLSSFLNIFTLCKIVKNQVLFVLSWNGTQAAACSISRYQVQIKLIRSVMAHDFKMAHHLKFNLLSNNSLINIILFRIIFPKSITGVPPVFQRLVKISL